MRAKRPPTVVVSVRDEPPDVAPGTLVEIRIVELNGPGSVYGDMLFNPYEGEPEKVLAASTLLVFCHERYRVGREQGLGQEHSDHWTLIVRLLGLVTTTINELPSCPAGSHSLVELGGMADQVLLLARLLTSMQATILNLLYQSINADAAVWRGIDSSFADIVHRITRLRSTSERLLAAQRAAATTVRYLSVPEYLADPISATTFVNHDDFLRALDLAGRIGLGTEDITIGICQGLAVVSVVRGVR